MNQCDRCGAIGRARFTKGELELIFCRHHGREYAYSVTREGFQFDEEYAAELEESLVNA